MTHALRLTALALLPSGLLACTVVPATPAPAGADAAVASDLARDEVSDPAGPAADAEDAEDATEADGRADAGPGSSDVDIPPEDVPVGPVDVWYGGFDTALPPEDVAEDTGGSDLEDAGGDAGPVLPPHTVPAMTRWRLVWSDEFDGPPCDPAAPDSCPDAATRDRVLRCFGSRASPVEATLIQVFHPDPATPSHWRRAVVPHFGDLDKCVWSVSEHVNSRHALGPSGVLMRYGAEAVTVTRGELRLRTRPTPGWSAATSDCGRKRDPYGPDTEENLGRSCPYEGANVTSQPMNGLARANGALGHASGDGRVFSERGRLEIRARMAAATANQAVVTTWAADPARFEDAYTLLGHASGNARETSHGLGSWQRGTAGFITARHAWNPPQAPVVADEFHTYAATWQTGESVRFDLNEVLLHRVEAGGGIEAGGQCLPVRVAGAPVHLMLSLMLSELAGVLGGPGHPPDTLSIDHVRWWEPCATDDPDPACVESTLSATCPNPCGGLGIFTGGVCDLGAPPEGTTAAMSGRYLGYNRGTGLNPCPVGGLWVDGLCAVVAIPEGRVATLRGGRWGLEPRCSPTRGLANCGAPCPVPGTRWEGDKSACFYRARIPGTNSFVYANQLYYGRLEGNPDGPCPYGGTFDGSNCHLGAAPPGHFVKTIGGDYYLEPHVCPDGGTWDAERKGCLMKAFAEGTETFVYVDGVYYRTPIAGNCAQGGRWDGANCRFLDIPAGGRAFTEGSKVYLRAPCIPSSDWGALASHPGTTTVAGGACRP